MNLFRLVLNQTIILQSEDDLFVDTVWNRIVSFFNWFPLSTLIAVFVIVRLIALLRVLINREKKIAVNTFDMNNSQERSINGDERINRLSIIVENFSAEPSEVMTTSEAGIFTKHSNKNICSDTRENSVFMERKMENQAGCNEVMRKTNGIVNGVSYAFKYLCSCIPDNKILARSPIVRNGDRAESCKKLC